MERTLSHFIEYDIKKPAAVADVIKSLQANDRLLRHAVSVIEQLVPGLEMEYKKVSVPLLSQGSPLKEFFALSVVLAFQKDLESEVPDLIQLLTGVDVPERFDALVTVVVLIVAILGIGRAIELMFPGRDKRSVDDAARRLAGDAGEILGKAPEVVLDAADAGFRGKAKRSLVVNSQRLFAPTRGDPDASIVSRSGLILVEPKVVELAQSAAAIEAADDADDEKPQSASEMMNGVDIILHAMDRDSKRRGWAGHIPTVSDERIPMRLEKTISPESLFGKDKIRGDVLLLAEEDDDGVMRPKEFLLLRAYL